MFNNARKHNMFKKGNGTIVIDMTGGEYYGKELKPEMLKTKPKNGTNILFIYDSTNGQPSR